MEPWTVPIGSLLSQITSLKRKYWIDGIMYAKIHRPIQLHQLIKSLIVTSTNQTIESLSLGPSWASNVNNLPHLCPWCKLIQLLTFKSSFPFDYIQLSIVQKVSTNIPKSWDRWDITGYFLTYQPLFTTSPPTTDVPKRLHNLNWAALNKKATIKSRSLHRGWPDNN